MTDTTNICVHPRSSAAMALRIAVRLAIVVAMFAQLFAAPLRAADADGRIAHWVFEKRLVRYNAVVDQVTKSAAAIEGTWSLTQQGKAEVLVLNGQTTEAMIATDHTKAAAALPTGAFTVEAWVRIDALQDWGGILCVLQDNGNYEKGWMLGTQKDKFSFALSTKGADDGDGVLTYLTSGSSFEPERWHHVVGSYDGKSQRIYVDGELDGESAVQHGDILYPPKTWYVLGSYRDDNEHYPIKGMLHEVAVYDRALTPAQIAAKYQAKRALFPEPPQPYAIATGPWVTFVDDATVAIDWQTEEPESAVIEYGVGEPLTQRITLSDRANSHRATIAVQPHTTYRFRIRPNADPDDHRATPVMTFDTTFNYRPITTKVEPESPYADDALTQVYAAAAERIIKDTGITRGYCLVLGCEQGRLAYELAKRTDLTIVAVDDNADNVAAARQALDKAGLYGVRVSVHQADLKDPPYGSMMANLVVSDRLLVKGDLPTPTTAINRLIRPVGGVAYLTSASKTGDAAAIASRFKSLNDDTLAIESLTDGVRITRGALPGASDWTHQYGKGDNSSCSGDDLVKGAMTVAWWGRPGPRPMPDRGARNPAPVAAGGMLYIQGDRILFGIDQYNGTVRWSLMAPNLRRTNMPRDGSNMAAASDYLYVVAGAYCEGIVGATGERKVRFKVPAVTHEDGASTAATPDAAAPAKPDKYDWGYLAIAGDALLGSAVAPGAAYQGDVGEWYEDITPDQIARVVGRHVFALDRHTGKLKWLYKGGAIINSTITVAGGRVYFIESRSDTALIKRKGRMVDELNKDQRLVALDLATGKVAWEKEHDFSPATVMTYLSFNNDTLLVTGGDTKKQYHLWAFDASAGSTLWTKTDPAGKTHHSGHLQHPALIGDRIFVNRQIIALRSGQVLRTDIAERRGCGTMAASNHALFYRHFFHGMWDLESDTRSEFLGIRGGCWLGQIPAGGMLLAPETSSGCSCTHALQTTVGFMPRTLAGQ